MSIELPKDAEGREIPLDTNALYLVKDGLKQNVERFTFELKDAEWSVETNIAIYDTEDFSLTQPGRPDSWEKLEEDLDRAIDAPKPYNYDSMTCGYFDNAGSSCQECKKKNGFDSFNCNKVAWKDILSRIRKLRGENE